jgi:hypothetical protein
VSRLLPILLAGEPAFTASRYMPAARVEIAFNAGYATADADRVWTDVSEYVELEDRITIDHGRQDELTVADANTLRLTLDNSDGRFTVGRVASPYYPNVKLGRPIRVSVMTVEGHTSVRYVGFIDDWPCEWDGTDAYASAKIGAHSRLAWLAGTLGNVVSAAVTADDPAAYWTLGDPAGATEAQEASGDPQVGPLIATGDGAAIVFGNATGPGTDGLTAAEFADGQYLRASMENRTPEGAPVVVTLAGVGAYIVTSTVDQGVLVAAYAGASVSRWVITAGGKLEVQGGLLLSTTTVSDGALHHIAATDDGATSRLYVDGVEEDSGATGLAGAIDSVTVGESYTGTLAHVALFDVAPSAASIAAHAQAGADGFEDDAPGDRIERYATYARIPTSEVDADTGSTPIAHADTTGTAALELMRKVEEAERGVLHDSRDGLLRFRARTSRYNPTAAFTLDAAEQEVEAEYVAKVDRTSVINEAKISTTDGREFRAVDTASRDDYGPRTRDEELLTNNGPAAEGAANHLVNTYAEPAPRVPTLSVDLLPFSPERQAGILSADVGSLVSVSNLPAQAAETDVDYFIEGYTEVIGPESHTFVFNVSLAEVLAVYVIGDPVRGQLDSVYRIAY